MSGAAQLLGIDEPVIPAERVENAPVNSPRWQERIEWFVVALVALAAAALHIRFVTEVGALWRDETNSVNLATLPNLADVWRNLDFDSFPALYFMVLRVWTGVFGAGNDEALRVLGLIIGLGLLGVLWANARSLGSRVPLLSLALVGLNPMIVRYGDSNRAYGLGIFLILLTLRSVWQLVERPEFPSAKRIAIAAVLAVLSVQCLYYNSVLLLAIACGAVAVALRERNWRKAAVVLGVGAVAAISLLPYAPIILRMRDWTFLVSYPATFSWLWQRVGEVLGAPSRLGIWLWMGLLAIGLGAAIIRGFIKQLPASALFAAVTLVVGVIGYACFLRALNYYTQPWYYITLVVFAACLLDVLFGTSLRSLRPVVALTLLFFTMPTSWKEIPTHHTNVDFVASQIQGLAKAGDLVLMPRWECAIPFARYYHGRAEVMTIPPLTDHRFHRYDLVLAQMRTDNAQQPVLDKMEQTLRSGRRVFFADTLPFEKADVTLPALRPPFQDANGVWRGGPYNAVWQVYAARFLRAHATRAGKIDISLPPGVAVQEFEELTPGVAEGWK